MAQQVCRRQKMALGVGPLLAHLLRQGFSLFTNIYNSLASLNSRGFPVSVSHIPIEMWGEQTMLYQTLYGFRKSYLES